MSKAEDLSKEKYPDRTFLALTKREAYKAGYKQRNDELGERMFSLEEMLDCWDEAESVPHDTKDRYFKYKFNIDL